ncbi:hypothetical protein GH714_034736 [Hevea brasiliensis]|uniref:Cytochrome P450 n=1 Tax=Hevea brasiliensis TaxID=3981 RepID=A0A6A6KYE7_HEVBR|nr:hypothetical protein GH714_034736 [Hevea brasiliensis]
MSMATLTSLPPQWLSIVAVFLLPILTLLLFRGKDDNKKKGLKIPPGPGQLPFIGNLHQLSRQPYVDFWKMAKKYGPVVQLQLGRCPTVVLSSTETAEELMKDRDVECCSRPLSVGPGQLSYNFLDVAFSPFSDYWREMRKLFISKLLSMRRVQSFWYAREEQMDKLIEILDGAYPNPVNLTEKVFNMMDGIIGTIAFGRTTYAQQEFRDGFMKVLAATMDMLASFDAENFFPVVGKFIDYLSGALAKRQRTFNNIDRYFQKVIEQHLDPNRPKPETEDIVDVLIGLMKDGSASFKITGDHLKAILMNVFVGGTDTSAVTITWAFSELLKNPKLMKKAQEEVRNAVGPNKRRVEGKEVEKIKYIDCIVKETFRKHPPTPLLIPHFSMKHCKIGGYDILPGSTIYVNAWAMGKDPTIWDNPEEFYPDRFMNSEVDYRGSHFELVPFGAGRRICPGLAMATTAVKYILANLLYGWDYEMPEGQKFEDFPLIEEGGLSVHNKQDIMVIPKKHKWD